MKRNNETEGLQYRRLPNEKLVGINVYGKRQVMMARCTRCKEIKNFGEYYWVGELNPVRKSWCTVCHNADTTQRSKDFGYGTKSHKKSIEANAQKLKEYNKNRATLEEFFA